MKERIPDKIIRAGGREFRLYLRYDDVFEKEMLEYPDFDGNPEYTNDGRPFRVMADESCTRGKSRNPESYGPGDCGSCAFFRRDEPYAAIGVCMCDALKREPPAMPP